MECSGAQQRSDNSNPPEASFSGRNQQESHISYRTVPVPFCSLTQGVVTAATGAGLTVVLRRAFRDNSAMHSSLSQGKETVGSATIAPPPPQPDHKPANDVVAGAVARAASQSTIHPLDTMKVRMQTSNHTKTKIRVVKRTSQLQRNMHEVKSLYKGVVGAATGAGIIIGTYFAFYSTTKKFLRQSTQMNEGTTAFLAGATAALGSSVVKVPLAVCIRSVQAGVYKNVYHAAKSIVSAAGVRGLFTGFVPTILEDVPDMAVKFAVYETLRSVHQKLRGDKPANIAEDLIMGGVAGAAAAAATTPLDVVKTVMMCSASSRPTLLGAARSVMLDGRGIKPFFRGVGPRALSNGLNSAIFFCFFEAIRQILTKREQQALIMEQSKIKPLPLASRLKQALVGPLKKQELETISAARPAGSTAACLSLALPVVSKGDDEERLL